MALYLLSEFSVLMVSFVAILALHTAHCDILLMSKLVSASAPAFATANESACFSQCSQNSSASAVSYSPYQQQCIKSTCANLQVIPDARWKTYVCVILTPPCSYPTPMFDWMLTDTCGFANTGWLNPGVLMYPVNQSFTNPWNCPYTPALSSYVGNSVLYPGKIGYLVSTAPMNYTMDLRTNSLTLFTYFRLIGATYEFLLVEFQSGNTYSSGNVASRFWMFNGGLHYNFGFMGCNGDCVSYFNYVPPLNTWVHVALVYDAAAQRFTRYVNGVIMSTSAQTVFSTTQSTPVVRTGGRQTNFGNLEGTTFCLKIFQAALSSQQILNVAASCATGRIMNV